MFRYSLLRTSRTQGWHSDFKGNLGVLSPNHAESNAKEHANYMEAGFI